MAHLYIDLVSLEQEISVVCQKINRLNTETPEFAIENIATLLRMLRSTEETFEKNLDALHADYLREAEKVALEALRKHSSVRQSANGQYILYFYLDPDSYFAKHLTNTCLHTAAENKNMNLGAVLFNKIIDEYKESDHFSACRAEILNSMTAAVQEQLGCIDFDEVENLASEIFTKTISLRPDNYLNEEVRVPIMLDTGDGAYDYSLNTILAPNGRQHKSLWMSDKSSLRWLLEEQGYSANQLIQAYTDYSKKSISDSFLCDMVEEIINGEDGCCQVVFLTKMTIRDLLLLNMAMTEGIGSITITNPRGGLFDKVHGRGGMNLCKYPRSITIPVQIIKSAKVDMHHDGDCDDYGVDEIFDFCDSEWKNADELQMKLEVSDAVETAVDDLEYDFTH